MESSALAPLITFFDSAAQKLKYPAVTITLQELETPVYISRTGAKSTMPIGCLTIRSQRQFNGSTYYGYIDRNGNWRGKTRNQYTAQAYTPTEWEFLQNDLQRTLTAFAQNPTEFAALQGQHYNHCCFCALELTHPDSVAAGYGPICADNWNLPHSGMAKMAQESAQLDKAETAFDATPDATPDAIAEAHLGATLSTPATPTPAPFKLTMPTMPAVPAVPTPHLDFIPAATEIHGVLQIDHHRGVIYFHTTDEINGCGRTILRLCSLPAPIPAINHETFLDVTHMVGASWHAANKTHNQKG